MIQFLIRILESLKALFEAKKPELPQIENISPIKLEPKPTELLLDQREHTPAEFGDWYPKAIKSKHILKTKGKYAKGYPLGAVIHFSAGHDGAENLLSWAKTKGFCFFAIQKDGKVFQGHPIREWGYHAGESRWTGLFGGVSDDLVGIEITSAGKLTEKDGKLWTYWAKEIPKDKARFTKGKDNQERGWYEAFTPEQEQSLIELLTWLKSQAPDVFSYDLVLGHDEVSPGRKNDPGAALSMTMPEFRDLLKKS